MAGCSATATPSVDQIAVTRKQPEKTMNTQETKFYCNPSALNKDERARYSELTKKLKAENAGVEELANGYSLRFPANAQTIRDAAEFVTYERLCCPFLDFQVDVAGENVALRLTGEEGVKEFIKAEIGL
jgi:hypothetical protein